MIKAAFLIKQKIQDSELSTGMLETLSVDVGIGPARKVAPAYSIISQSIEEIRITHPMAVAL